MKEQLQELRKAAKLTQEEAANRFGVKLSTYQKYERDAISPPYDVLISIADFYQVSTDYLLGRTTVKAMATLAEDEPTDLECKCAGEAMAKAYDDLPIELQRAFVKMMESMFGDIFGRLSDEDEQEQEPQDNAG